MQIWCRCIWLYKHLQVVTEKRYLSFTVRSLSTVHVHSTAGASVTHDWKMVNLMFSYNCIRGIWFGATVLKSDMLPALVTLQFCAAIDTVVLECSLYDALCSATVCYFMMLHVVLQGVHYMMLYVVLHCVIL